MVRVNTGFHHILPTNQTSIYIYTHLLIQAYTLLRVDAQSRVSVLSERRQVLNIDSYDTVHH